MFRKTIAMFLTLIICTSVIALCGGRDTSEVYDEQGAFIPEKELVLTVWQTQGNDYKPKNLDDNIVEDWLINKTKVRVGTVYGNDGGQWGEKLTKLVVGDNLPDIVACSSGQGLAHFAKLDSMGKVWELTPEMIKKYAPNLWRRTPSRLWEQMKVKGKILGIPYEIPYMSSESREIVPDITDEQYDFLVRTLVSSPNEYMAQWTGYLFIRDDILKQFYPEAKSFNELKELLDERQRPIGEELLDIRIYSTEDYIKFMYDIKNAQITSGGDQVYAFGYSGGDLWEALTWLGADMYGYKGHNYTSTWNEEKREIEIPIVGEMIKTAARTQNKMINDGVIDPGSLFHTIDQFTEKVLAGKYAIAATNIVGTMTDVNNKLKERGAPFRYRPFVTKVPPLPNYDNFTIQYEWNKSLCFLTGISEEEVYQVLNWINVQYSDEYEAVVNWGPPEAGLYTTDKDVQRRFVDERFTKYYVEGDVSVLTPEQTRGLRGPIFNVYNMGGLFGVMARNGQGRWYPPLMYKSEYYTTELTSGFKLPAGSIHTQNVKKFPNCVVWAPEFGDIPEVVTYWSERGRWEDRFKRSLASPEEDFDREWQQGVDYLRSIVDIDEMARKMTEIVRNKE